MWIWDHCCQSHIVPFLEIENAKIWALCDLNSEAIEDTISTYWLDWVSIYTNSEELFTDPAIDAVVISTPDRFHAPQLLDWVNKGKHILVEKPLADSLEAMDKVMKALDLAEDKWLIVTSCHPRRFDPPFIWMKDNLKGYIQQYGNIISFKCDFSYHKPSKENLHSWMIDDHFNHEIDLTNYLFGITWFKAHALENDQTRYAAAWSRDDDISFFFEWTRKLDERVYPEYFQVRFERWDLKINTKTWKCTILDHQTNLEYLVTCWATAYEERFLGVNQNFIDAITWKSKNYLTATDMYINTISWLELTLNWRYEIKKTQ